MQNVNQFLMQKFESKLSIIKGLTGITFFIFCAFAIGCTHLLYPAIRHPFVDSTKLRPVPLQKVIPVENFMGDEASDAKPLFAGSEGELHSWFFPSQTSKRLGLVLHFHGNGQNLTTHFIFFMWVIDNGFDYMIFDYRGYGASSDDSATPIKTVQDGMTMLKYVKDNNPGVPIIAVGQSLGSNVLVRTLQELNTQKALQKYLPDMVVLDSSFLSYQQAGSSVLSQRWFLYPLKPLAYLTLNDTWAAIKKIDQTPSIPALYFHGAQDQIIRKELGNANFEKWPGPKAFVEVPGGHISAFADPASVRTSRLQFLSCFNSVINKSKNFSTCKESAN